MRRMVTIRLTEELAIRLAEVLRKIGLPVGRIIRQQLGIAKAEGGKQAFLRRAGQISGPADISSRKGFSHE